MRASRAASPPVPPQPVAPDAEGRRHSRPATDEDVKRLVRALNAAGADYLLMDLAGLLKTKARSDRPKDIADRQLLERALRGA